MLKLKNDYIRHTGGHLGICRAVIGAYHWCSMWTPIVSVS